MAFRVPPPIIYQNEEARLTAARKDYRGGRYRSAGIALRAVGGAARVVTWPLRAVWHLARPVG